MSVLIFSSCIPPLVAMMKGLGFEKQKSGAGIGTMERAEGLERKRKYCN